MSKSDEQKAVSVYMPLELYQQLMEFKSQENLRSDSQAINLLVGRCLKATNGNVAPTDRSLPAYQRLSQLEETISDIASRLKQVEGTLLTNVPSNVPDPVESTLPDPVESTLPDPVESTVLSNPPGNLDSNPESDSLKLVICEVDKEVRIPRYWSGATDGFTNLLSNAKRYKSQGMIKRTIKGILEDPDYSYFEQEKERYEIQYNTVEFCKKPHLVTYT